MNLVNWSRTKPLQRTIIFPPLIIVNHHCYPFECSNPPCTSAIIFNTELPLSLLWRQSYEFWVTRQEVILSSISLDPSTFHQTPCFLQLSLKLFTFPPNKWNDTMSKYNLFDFVIVVCLWERGARWWVGIGTYHCLQVDLILLRNSLYSFIYI